VHIHTTTTTTKTTTTTPYHIYITSHTSSMYLGLSGKMKYIKAPISAGRADTARKTRQLRTVSPAHSKSPLLRMSQAKPPHKKRPNIQKMDWEAR